MAETSDPDGSETTPRTARGEATLPHRRSRGQVLGALLDRRHEHWILASMLLLLHTALDAGLDSALSAALLTAHLGLFFLWQPIWQRDQRLDPKGAALIAVLIAAMLMALDWWIVFGWLVLLIGIVAGRSFSTRPERYAYMLTLAFLVSELLVTCTTMLFFGKPLDPAIAQPFRLALYLIPAVLYAIPPITAPQREPFPVDFFRGIAFALMTALLAVFSVLITLRFELDYPLALVGTLMALGLFLLFLGWITTPGSDNIGLRAVWEKSVLNIGTPFEAWLGNIANLARQRSDADDFLEAAVGELVDIPWVSAVEWSCDAGSGIEGQRTRNHLTVETDALTVTLYTERAFSSALLIHCRLLIQVLGHFYVAKRRENEEANEAHLRAIHETGARVTHDIKNLLQSLRTMTASLEGAVGPEREQAGFKLLKRRLPDVARRLQLSLDKLQRPSQSAPDFMPAATWWQNTVARETDQGVACQGTLEETGLEVPRDVLDSVLDNLLDNARHKVAAGRAARIELSAAFGDGRVEVSVTDDGEPLEPTLARALFQQPVASATGLGVGLYQAARQAQRAGGELRLAQNEPGRVRFELTCPVHAPPGSEARPAQGS